MDQSREVNINLLNNMLIESVAMRSLYLEDVGAKNADADLLEKQQENILAIKKANEDLLLSNIDLICHKIEKCQNQYKMSLIQKWIDDQMKNIALYINFQELRSSNSLMHEQTGYMWMRLNKIGKEYGNFYENVIAIMKKTQPRITGITLTDAIDCFPYQSPESASKIFFELESAQGMAKGKANTLERFSSLNNKNNGQPGQE